MLFVLSASPSGTILTTVLPLSIRLSSPLYIFRRYGRPLKRFAAVNVTLAEPTEPLCSVDTTTSSLWSPGSGLIDTVLPFPTLTPSKNHSLLRLDSEILFVVILSEALRFSREGRREVMPSILHSIGTLVRFENPISVLMILSSPSDIVPLVVTPFEILIASVNPPTFSLLEYNEPVIT